MSATLQTVKQNSSSANSNMLTIPQVNKKKLDMELAARDALIGMDDVHLDDHDSDDGDDSSV